MSRKLTILPKEIQSQLSSMGLDQPAISRLEREMNQFLALLNSKESSEVLLSSIQEKLSRLDGDLKSLKVDQKTTAGLQQKLNSLRSLLQNTDQATIMETLGKLKKLDLQKQDNSQILSNLMKNL